MAQYHHHITGPGGKVLRSEVLNCTVLKKLKSGRLRIKIKINGRITTVKSKNVTGKFSELNPINYNIDMPVPYKD